MTKPVLISCFGLECLEKLCYNPLRLGTVNCPHVFRYRLCKYPTFVLATKPPASLFMNTKRTQLHNNNFITCPKAEKYSP